MASVSTTQFLTSITDLQNALHNGHITVREVVEYYLQQIEKLNEDLNAITTINPRALEEASRLDTLFESQRGPLHGVPLLIKDQFETSHLPTTFGSTLCKSYTPTRTAPIINTLLSAGALILAKTTQPDWAAGWFSPSSLTGTTAHPLDPSRDPGGSSSGCGTAVAAGMGLVGIGGDTCGSIRLPASFCGIVGVRATPGRILTEGMSSLVQGLDTPGPMCGCVEDAARVLDVLIEGERGGDVSKTPFRDAVREPVLQGRRIGVLRQVFGSHGGIRGVLEEMLGNLDDAGCQLIEVEIPNLENFMQSTSVYTLRSRADINAFCASREELAHIRIEDVYTSGSHHRSINLTGALVMEDFSKNPLYAVKLEEMKAFQRDVVEIYEKFRLDAMVYPTCQVLAPKTRDILDLMWFSEAFPTNTAIGSYLLFTSLSVPIGKAKDDDYPEDPELPVGLEILGVPFSEERILNIAAGVERIVQNR